MKFGRELPTGDADAAGLVTEFSKRVVVLRRHEKNERSCGQEDGESYCDQRLAFHHAILIEGGQVYKGFVPPRLNITLVSDDRAHELAFAECDPHDERDV